jgi:hypothetical protein
VSESLKACVDCRFCTPPHFMGQICSNQMCGEPDVVHGMTFSGARQAREDETKCGRGARYFERRRISQGVRIFLFFVGVPVLSVCAVIALIFRIQ